ncbi:uncharacterized protein PpBr36_11367 [Pyricularia pennisetigena]|uniref:uncharacterized protein n=1 Tax=Pyricularia pennisetigena TaxID=1578925 RepID=UPI0011539323|nr:uncharacterized protein PpBr36_11367 [Pyricularia pennisetigena]TLS20365.1 hypothetical protein PpBr36_11367 [Pyricularia pennisetigena]
MAKIHNVAGSSKISTQKRPTDGGPTAFYDLHAGPRAYVGRPRPFINPYNERYANGTHAGPKADQGSHPGPKAFQGSHPGPKAFQGSHPGPKACKGLHAGPGTFQNLHAGPRTFQNLHAGPKAYAGP